MKAAIKDGRIVLAQIEQARMDKLKKTGMLRWNKAARTYSAPVTLDLLNALAQIFTLPDCIETERRRLAGVARELDAQRAAAEPAPLVPYPVRARMFRHQVRAANMALIQLASKPSAGFGLLFEMGWRPSRPSPTRCGCCWARKSSGWKPCAA